MTAKIIALLSLLVACSSDNSSEKTSNTVDQQGLFNKQVLVLDAKALSQVYKKFFSLDSEDIFTPEEKKSLGEISYDNINPLLQNGFHLRDPNQAYIKTLRVKLAELCPELVRKELTKVSSDSNADTRNHHLVFHHDAPSVEHVSKSMRLMFNLPSSSPKPYGADEYAELFAKNIDQSTDREEKITTNYVLLCMAIGQDARTYLR